MCTTSVLTIIPTVSVKSQGRWPYEEVSRCASATTGRILLPQSVCVPEDLQASLFLSLKGIQKQCSFGKLL